MLDGYSGATRLYVIIGDPIAQVKAPSGLTRELTRRGKDWIVVPLQLTPADVGAGIPVLSRAGNVDGLIATVPHKFALASHCATLSERARFLGAANVARRNADGSWHGDMLDGEGFADEAAWAVDLPSRHDALALRFDVGLSDPLAFGRQDRAHPAPLHPHNRLLPAHRDPARRRLVRLEHRRIELVGA